ncbi:hypothetical protein EC912_1094 [Luteibacter rhizovicinus]|uniref:Uncharacterized protein n=1 Tax=Luteibacter rhizovicinus TaxID=242606 RepID=A0A4R3YL47_9GAMM|nr:hypothetical protein [Luteibacter rhizovicinus]TCV91774.1 hypothetical protein EC912_1094 [Luteibacter rhizovicinus]
METNESRGTTDVCVNNALAEMLQLLFAGHQDRVAGVLLDRCPREALEALLASRDYVLHGRVRYVVEDRLRFRKRTRDEQAYSCFRAMQFVLNTWCQEGRRSAIRKVLAELDDEGLDRLGGMPGLDDEVVSIMRDFRQ